MGVAIPLEIEIEYSFEREEAPMLLFRAVPIGLVLTLPR